MSWKVHETDEVFAALRGLCSNSYRMYDPSEHRSYYDHDCETYECAVEDAAQEYERLLRHCNHQREQLKAWGNVSTLRKIMEDGMDNIDGGTEVERIEGSSKVRAGSSITDELRMYVQDWRDTPSLMDGLDRGDVDGILEDFIRIADRIDERYHRDMATAQQVGINEGEDAAMRDGWVELPKDADGEYIQAVDVLDGYGKTIEVVELRYGRSGWVLISRDGNGYADTFAFTHHHTPTVEDVLREFFSRYVTTKPKDEDDAILAEYAAKLRLAKEVKR